MLLISLCEKKLASTQPELYYIVMQSRKITKKKQSKIGEDDLTKYERFIIIIIIIIIYFFLCKMILQIDFFVLFSSFLSETVFNKKL